MAQLNSDLGHRAATSAWRAPVARQRYYSVRRLAVAVACIAVVAVLLYLAIGSYILVHTVRGFGQGGGYGAWSVDLPQL